MQVCLRSKQLVLHVPHWARRESSHLSLCEPSTAATGLISSAQVKRFRCFHWYIMVFLFKLCKFFGLINTGRQMDYVNLGLKVSKHSECSQVMGAASPQRGPMGPTRLSWVMTLSTQCVSRRRTEASSREQLSTTFGHRLPAGLPLKPVLGTALINT